MTQMDAVNHYPLYLKSQAHGLYFKIMSPFDYDSVRVIKTDSGSAIAFCRTESGRVNTAHIENSGYEECTKEEFEARVKEASQLVQSYHITS